VREFLRMALELDGHAVEGAAGGEQALRRLARGGVDLLILDLCPPGTDAVATIRVVAREFPGLAVLATSGGRARLEVRLQARGLGAATIHRPFTVFQLASAVRRALAGSRPAGRAPAGSG
jgi:DNA-binding response OmpR family regulator